MFRSIRSLFAARTRSPRPAATRARLGGDGLSLDGRLVPTVFASYSVVNDQQTWFEARVKLTNDGAAAVPFDSLQFSLPSRMTSIWDAAKVNQYRDVYSVTHGSWNASIPAGGSVSFGFTADAGSSKMASGFSLGGVRLADAPAGYQLSFQTTGDWGGSMNGQITVKNTGSAPLKDWRLGFTFPGVIDSMWNGVPLARTGNRIEAGPAWYNQTIPAGGTVQVGFSAHPGGLSATDLTLTASAATPPANRAPVAGADSAAATAGVAVKVSVLANDSDPDGDALAVQSVGTPAHGTAVRNSDNTVTYTAASGYVGTDSFTYTVSDGRGGTATGTVSVNVTAPVVAQPPAAAPSSWPAQVFAPYVDVSLPDKSGQFLDLPAIAQRTGVKYYSLGFIVADTLNRPSWGGYNAYAINGEWFDNRMRTQVAGLRSQGGDAVISFGGATGTELATVAGQTEAGLTAAYRTVIDAYKTDKGAIHVDFDIEGDALKKDGVIQTASIDLRSKAIAALQQEASKNGKELNVRFTLPVNPTGLEAPGQYLLESAKQFGVRVDGVNVMAMEYGDSAAPSPQGKMGYYATKAGEGLYAQLTDLFGTTTTDAQRWRMVGVTPMIGQNESDNEVFKQQDARDLLAWANAHQIGSIGMWSINRDHADPTHTGNDVDLYSTGLAQTDYEFSGIFKPFTSTK